MSEARTSKWVQVVGLAAIGVALALIALVVYWRVYPYDDLYRADDPMTITNGTVFEPGDAIVFERPKVCTTGGITYTVERWAAVPPTQNAGSGQFELPEVRYDAINSTCREPWIGQVYLPNYLPDGTYTLIFETTFRANPIRTMLVVSESPSFTIKRPTV